MLEIKKICFIGAGLVAGGQERHLSGLANYYAKQGYGVSIINLFRTEQFFQLEDNIEIIWPDFERKKYPRFIYAFKTIPYLRKSLKRLKPDVILSFGEWFSPYVLFSTRFLNIHVFPFELMGPTLNLGKLIETLRKLTYKYAKGVIVQTSIAAEIIKKKTGAVKVFIIPTPVNIIETENIEKKNQLVSVGRLSKEKGHIILLRAFAKITDKNWTLHLIGDGPERNNLETEAEKLGVTNRVIFHGHLKNFNKLLGESEIFVLPSFYEGFPNALLEAMSVPLACISSNCVAGPSDIIEHGKNGMLVETGNVDELAAAIERLIADKELRENIAKEAYKVRETYKFEKIANQYLDFIQKTINNR